MLVLGIAIVCLLAVLGVPGWELGVIASTWIAPWLLWTWLKVWSVKRMEK